MDDDKLRRALPIVILVAVLIIIFVSVYALSQVASRGKNTQQQVAPPVSNTQINPYEQEEDEEEEEQYEEQPTVDLNEDVPKKVKYVEEFLEYENNPDSGNIMDEATVRLAYTQFVLTQLGKTKTTSDPDVQPSAFSSKALVEGMYRELFGDLHTLGTDEKNRMKNNCDAYKTLKGGDTFYCWNDSMGTQTPYIFDIKNKQTDNNDVIYTGEYSKKSYSANVVGTFEFVFENQDGNFALKSVQTTKN